MAIHNSGPSGSDQIVPHKAGGITGTDTWHQQNTVMNSTLLG